MKIDVTRELTNVEGNPRYRIGDVCPLCNTPQGEKRIATLRWLCVDALSATYADEVDQRGRLIVTGEQKVQRWQLALQIQGEDTPDLSVDDLALLKSLIAKRFGPVEVGQAWAMLDPRESNEKEAE